MGLTSPARPRRRLHTQPYAAVPVAGLISSRPRSRREELLNTFYGSGCEYLREVDRVEGGASASSYPGVLGGSVVIFSSRSVWFMYNILWVGQLVSPPHYCVNSTPMTLVRNQVYRLDSRASETGQTIELELTNQPCVWNNYREVPSPRPPQSLQL